MNTRNLRAFTRVELVIVIAVAAVLSVLVVLPQLARSHSRSCRVNCVSNLKQIGIAHRLFANDNDGPFVSQTTVGWPDGGKYVPGKITLLACYQLIENELSSPKVLMCPVDEEFKTRTPASSSFTNLTEQSISYFLGIDADETRPAMILSGDRNLCSDLKGNTLFPADGVRTNAIGLAASWQKKTIHRDGGNLGLTDGSAQQTTSKELLNYLSKTGDTNNTVLLPKP